MFGIVNLKMMAVITKGVSAFETLVPGLVTFSYESTVLEISSLMFRSLRLKNPGALAACIIINCDN